MVLTPATLAAAARVDTSVQMRAGEAGWWEKSEAGIMRRRNERNGAPMPPYPSPITPGRLARLGSCPSPVTPGSISTQIAEGNAKPAATSGSAAWQSEIGIDELVAIFWRADLKSASALGVMARVCRAWRKAASHLRRDCVWQLSSLAVIDGVPEAFMVPHSSAQLATWVAERPREAVALLSIRQLRDAGAPAPMVAERLDFGDGIKFTVARPMDAASQSRTARARRELWDEGASGAAQLLCVRNLPIVCSLERDAPGGEMRVLVCGRHVGNVPASFAESVELGEARLVSVGFVGWGFQGEWQNWRIVALPRVAPV